MFLCGKEKPFLMLLLLHNLFFIHVISKTTVKYIEYCDRKLTKG